MSGALFVLFCLLTSSAFFAAGVFWFLPKHSDSYGELVSAPTRLETDLALVRLSYPTYLIAQLVSFSLGGFVAGFVWSVAGVSVFTVAISGALCLGCAFIPSYGLRQLVKLEQQDMESTVGVFQRLAAVQVAGGSEVSQALRTSVLMGSGRSWDRLRSSIYHGFFTSSQLSDELQKLSEVYRSSQLLNLANLLSVSEGGGVAQSSLERLSASQARHRSRQLIERAQTRTAQMVIPIGCLFLAFVLFIGLVVIQVLTEVRI